MYDDKSVVFAYGRFNPPTIGHDKLAKKMKSLSLAYGCRAIMVISKTHNKNNPIDPGKKLKYISQAYSDIDVQLADGSIIEHLESLSKEGYRTVYVVAGQDRTEEYKILLNKYNNKLYTFDRIVVCTAGQRDSNKEGVVGISSSILRNAARNQDYKLFEMGITKNLSSNIIKEIYEEIKQA